MARALGCYEGSLKKIIHQWKYQGKLSVTPLLGEWLACGVVHYWGSATFDLLIPVPLHVGRLRKRGFNQALLLVREMSRRTGIPLEARLLKKRKPTVPQIMLSGAEREKALQGAIKVTDQDRLKEKTILLVDDVYTTGATVNECARVLVKAGAKRVDILTVAHAVRRT